MSSSLKNRIKTSSSFRLIAIDSLFYVFACVVLLILYPFTVDRLSPTDSFLNALLGYVCVFGIRLFLLAYRQIWRYANTREYLILVFSDFAACILFVLLMRLLPKHMQIMRAIALIMANLLGSITMRFIYQFVYQHRESNAWSARVFLGILYMTTGIRFNKGTVHDEKRVRVAIVGAGSVGVMLAQELFTNPSSTYVPVCFVDSNQAKIGRSIQGVDVVGGEEGLAEELRRHGVQEVIFALPEVSIEHKKELYEVYKGLGYKVKIYDYPTMRTQESGQRELRDFAIEDLLYRKSVGLINEETAAYYRGKSVLITGGGGSIGSELARQIAKLEPSRLVILDIYENGAYDIQQELLFKYGSRLNLRVEIVNVCDRGEMERVFQRHTPDIVLHAAAHKHVPLMERNCCEAVRNNVFGTLTTVEVCEKYGVKRFIMISTDKAVNPTNVMGATKRMCEMIVLSRTGGNTSFSATRFGNVLGSNGSVIPLFKRQIANGGPITLTDKRIIRYFMTIPEASQLVMTSGAMAKGGELYVLDMGKPVRILDLAENMIRLSGWEPYKDINIIETGLRPGEKLYEELLIKSETLSRTSNDLIFVESDTPLSREEIEEKLDILREALKTESNSRVREALKQVVPTYHDPEEVNARAEKAEEMKEATEGAVL